MTVSNEPIDVLRELSDHHRAAVSLLLEAATEADGVAPVSEHVVLELSSGADVGRHLLLGSGGRLLGYAHREDEDTTPTGAVARVRVREIELVVHPDYRRAGRGRALLESAAAGSASGDLADKTGSADKTHPADKTDPVDEVRVWSHGDQPGARALADRMGYRVVRTLLQLRRPLEGIEAAALPPGVTLRSFRPGADDAEWLRLNARAFAHHPEQGRTSQADLEARMREPWFDPKGFLIAEQAGVMIGFHWTKVHPEGLGEVYVIGVDPDRHGGGLGRALTQAGLRHLAALGLRTGLLYVESDNAPALAVYQRLGFTAWSTDVMYSNKSPQAN